MSRVARARRTVPLLSLFALLLGSLASLGATFTVTGSTTHPGTTFAVNTTDDLVSGGCDSSHCSLREAVTAANANAGADTITFAVAGTGPHTIAVSAALPNVTDPVTLDGLSQAAATASTPQIELAGPSSGVGLFLVGHTGSLVQGLVVNRFDTGILLYRGGGHTVRDNVVGLDPTGTTDLGNDHDGIVVFGATDNTIRNNLVSGNGLTGIWLRSGTYEGPGSGNTLAGNLVGTDRSGSAAIGNGSNGISVGTDANTIGGTDPADRNVVSGNGTGMSVGAANNTVAGNYVGLAPDGTTRLGNSLNGMNVGGTGHLIGLPGAGNVVSGNGQEGIQVSGSASSGISLRANRVGTDHTGTVGIGNGTGFRGISVWAPSTTVGGPDPEDGNLVSGNGVGIQVLSPGAVLRHNRVGTDVNGTSAIPNRYGVWAYGSGAMTLRDNLVSGNAFSGVRVERTATAVLHGNHIGTDASGTGALPNGNQGVFIYGSSNNQIGGPGAGEGNTIAHNGSQGVRVATYSADVPVGNRIVGNAIHSNGGSTDATYGLGIDLGASGPTANDADDLDTGDNGLQNFPVVTSASAGISTTVVGTLDSAPSATFTIDLYANAACDASGHGEGARYLGSTTATTDAAGDASWSGTVGASSAGEAITATATDAAGNTSELSSCATATGAPSPTAYDDRILFSSEVGGNRDVYTIAPDGTDRVRVTNDAGSELYATWSPDGTRIAYVQDSTSLRIVNADGSGSPTEIHTGVSLNQPTWSADGTRIAFAYFNGAASLGGTGYDIGVVNADGTGFSNLTSAMTKPDGQPGSEGDPVFSPDGATLAFGGHDIVGGVLSNEIFLLDMASATATPTQLTRSGGAKHRLEWLPSGDEVTYSGGQLTAVNVHDGSTRTYSMNLGATGYTWNGDASQVAYAGGVTGLFVRTLSPLSQTDIAPGEPVFYPEWIGGGSPTRPNTAPLANDDGYDADEGTPLVVAAPGVLGNDTDGDGDPLTAALVSGPTNGSVSLGADGGFTYTPDAGFDGTDTFAYTASDGTDSSASATVTITVAPGDRDADGVANDADNCPDTANPGQGDADGDGEGDACDADRDGDGTGNGTDTCPDLPDPGQEDTDGDGAGDACDPDLDGDGVANGSDNCPSTANAGQGDADGDGAGDACDPDLDGDGAANGSDNCPATANGDQADLDGDGIGDVCDDDRDGDGLSNLIEIWLGCDPDSPDTDGDGLWDLVEIWVGTNPLTTDTDDDGESDAAWLLRIVRLACGCTVDLGDDVNGNGVWDVVEYLYFGGSHYDPASHGGGGYSSLTEYLFHLCGCSPDVFVDGRGGGAGSGSIPQIVDHAWGGGNLLRYMIRCGCSPWEDTSGGGGGRWVKLYQLGGGIDLTDGDGDGIPTVIEILLGCDPHSTDSDGDGLSDFDEILVHGTDPLDADTDGDGMNDGLEIDLGCDPNDPDSDDDGEPDGTDPAPLAALAGCTVAINTWDPVPLGTPVELCVGLAGPGIASGGFDWGDGTSSTTGAAGDFTASHVYAEPGVYTVTSFVEDTTGGRHEVEHLVVVYDPDGGFVTGGGWITSPEGAYSAAPSVVAEASFGFVSKYKKDSTVPEGSLEFQLAEADLNFHSNTQSWLTVSDEVARFSGTGTINGEGDYGFVLTAVDRRIDGKDNVDAIRLRIWDRVSGDTVYDNEREASLYGDDATVLGNGSIVIHEAQ